MTTISHVEAVIAAVESQVPQWATVVRADDAPGVKTHYVQIEVGRIPLADGRMSPGDVKRAWRIVATWVTDSIGNASKLEAAVYAALENQVLSVPGLVAVHIQHQLTEDTEQNRDKWWTGFAEFTYVTAPT